MEPYKSYGRNGGNRTGNMNMNRNSNMNRNMNCNNDSNMRSRNDYDCNKELLNLNRMPLAMAYVPMQEWGELYKAETAIREGTAFPDLNKIFCGVRGR